MSDGIKIPKPRHCISYDELGKPYLVYRFAMPDGSYLDIDSKIVQKAKSKKGFLDAEYVRNYLGLGGHY